VLGLNVTEVRSAVSTVIVGEVRVTPSVPETVPVVIAVTGTVEMVNVAEAAPAGIVMLAGTDSAGLESVSVTTAPPAGAAPFKVAVPVTGFPPTTVAGLRLMEERVAGFTLRFADLVLRPSVAVTEPVVVAPTGVVVTTNVAVVAPAAIVTPAGTAAAGFAVESVNGSPPAGAMAFNVTVAVDDAPPSTLLGFKLMEANSALTVRLADLVTAR